MSYDFDFLNNTKEANREAVLLAKVRYNEQLAPFISSRYARDSEARLRYASDHIERIIDECVDTVPGADKEVVSNRVKEIIAKEVAVSQPEHHDADTPFFEGKGTTPDNYGGDPVGNAVQQDILDREAILVSEILDPDAQIDASVPISEGEVQYPKAASLKERFQDYHESCFRCQASINEGVVCKDCEGSLVPLAAAGYPASPLAQPGGTGTPLQQPLPQQAQQAPMQPVDPNKQFSCPVCGYIGNTAQVQDHYQKMVAANDQRHLDGQRGVLQPGVVQARTAAGDQSFLEHDHNREERAEGNPVHTDSDKKDADPSDQFEDVVQQIADKAAAKRYSQADDDELQEISSRYGVSTEDVTSHLHVVALFGDYIGFNGDIVDDEPDTSGLTSIDDQDLGGRVESHEALVPLETAIKRTAEKMGMDEKTVADRVQDALGGSDLPNQYHVSVDGQRNFYLPDSLVSGSADQTDQPAAQPTQDTGQNA